MAAAVPARHPVDRPPVEPTRLQADLKGGNGRVACGGLGGEGGSREGDERQSKERPGAHRADSFGAGRRNP